MIIEEINLNELMTKQRKSVAAIGYFDGVHKGHQTLLKKVIEIAEKDNLYKACITFKQDPFAIVKPDSDLDHLTTNDDKFDLLDHYGIEIVYLLDFNKQMANLSAMDFISLLKQIGIQTIICGDDFRFGANGIGDSKLLAENMPTIQMPFELYNSQKISSSTIEEMIRSGNILEANNCLNHAYKISGLVMHGNKVGRTINFPTANLKINEYIIPKNGVYFAAVKIKNKFYKGMVNIGYNPTINLQVNKRVEVHILDFDEYIYNEIIDVYFIKRIRDEKCFESKEALIDQLNIDKELIRGFSYEQITII